MAPTDSHHLTKGNTRGALDSLTLEIERDPVLSVRYGHSWKKSTTTEYKDPDSASKSRRIRFDALLRTKDRVDWFKITARMYVQFI
jgi:hypothetical protein